MDKIQLAILCAGAFSFFCFRFGRTVFRRIERAFCLFAEKRWAGAALGLVFFLVSVGLGIKYQPPQPRIADEFAYLMQADTFAHGHWSMPTHPQWKYFESYYVLQHPAYMSKYPPGNALVLALGQVVWQPILGVWITMAFFFAALFWMLKAIMPKPWALLGCVLAMINPQVFVRFNWYYMGGSLGLLGGALVLGGFFRNCKRFEAFPSIMMGIGAGILSLTRPFEGLVLTALVSLVLCYRWLKQKSSVQTIVAQWMTPLVVATMPFVAFHLFYNYKVTGSATTMPYMIYEREHRSSPLFAWSKMPEKHEMGVNPFFAKYAAYEQAWIDRHKSLAGLYKVTKTKFGNYANYFWDGLMFIFLIPMIAVWRRDRDARLMAVLFLIPLTITFGLGGGWFAFAHYSAPIFPLMIALCVLAMRELRCWKYENIRWGRLAERLFVIAIAISTLLSFIEARRESPQKWQYKRDQLAQQLAKDGQKHLVLVSYAPDHCLDYEWVYNLADIDSQPVIWARDLGGAANQPLLDYYRDRKVTAINVDDGHWGY